MEKKFTCRNCNNLLDTAFQSYSRPDICCFCKKKDDEKYYQDLKRVHTLNNMILKIEVKRDELGL